MTESCLLNKSFVPIHISLLARMNNWYAQRRDWAIRQMGQMCFSSHENID